jgi:tetraacyldisaccharide 4'-kinase
LGYQVILPVCGIGNPASFVKLVDSLAGQVAPALRFPDHHRYAASDVQRIRRAAQRCEADLVLTTRKDWVKLAPLWTSSDGLPALARLDIRLIVHDPDGALDSAITRALEAGA